MISDGDSKSYNAIKSLNYEVTKEECLNHVSKRMGTALRKVWKMKVDEIVFGGNGKGRRKKIEKLCKYYANAVRFYKINYT